MIDLSGTRVWLTGASSGIGHALALELLAGGARVAVSGGGGGDKGGMGRRRLGGRECRRLLVSGSAPLGGCGGSPNDGG